MAVTLAHDLAVLYRLVEEGARGPLVSGDRTDGHYPNNFYYKYYSAGLMLFLILSKA